MTRLPASTSQPLLPPLDCRRRHRCCCCCCISLLQSSVPVSLASAYLPVAVLVSSRSLLPCLSSAGQQRRLRQSAERRLCLRRLRTSHPDPRPHVRRRPAEQLRCRRSRAVCRFSCCQVASRTQRSPRGQYTQRARALSLSPSLLLWLLLTAGAVLGCLGRRCVASTNAATASAPPRTAASRILPITCTRMPLRVWSQCAWTS